MLAPSEHVPCNLCGADDPEPALTKHGFTRIETRLSGKYVTVRYLCDRTKAYGVGLARTLTGTIGRLPGADTPFPLPIGEFVTFAERPE